MDEYLPLATLAVTNLALVLGWVVSGTQRIGESLTSDRRSAYTNLLVMATARRNGSDNEVPLQDAEERALLVASDQMFDARLIDRLVASARGGDDWPAARASFLAAARFESQENSSLRRRFLRAQKYRAVKG